MSAERFFDDLARTLAEPMPRRRVLRVAAGALVAVLVPGMSARGALSAPSLGECPGKSTDEFDYLQCTCNFGAGPVKNCCINTKYLRHTCVCRGGADAAAVCKPIWECDEEKRGCGPCCPPGQVCNTLLGKCMCKRGEKCGPKCCQGSDCCINTRLRSDDPVRWVCCKPPNRCEAGVCECANGKSSCGGSECCKSRQWCTDCFRGTSDLTDDERVGERCCARAPGVTCCGNTCCKKNRRCCGAKCCPELSVCARASGKDVCCPSKRAVHVPPTPGRELGFLACCPPGTVATGGFAGITHCCPPGQPGCCPPTDGAGNVLDCGKGARICVSGRCVNP